MIIYVYTNAIGKALCKCAAHAGIMGNKLKTRRDLDGAHN